MRKTFMFTGIMIFSFFIFSKCSIFNVENESTVVATVGSEKITFENLEKAFQKNMNRRQTKLKEVSQDSVLDFLDLYIKYRLKVNDAVKRGFENDSSVVADLAQNRKLLAENYYYENKLIAPGIEELLNKRSRELKIAIILVSNKKGVVGGAEESGKKAEEALEKIKAGADFSEIAKEYSSDPRTAESGGVINNYITAGKVNYEIEKVIYAAKPGEVWPEVVDLGFGSLIVKVLENVPRIKVKASHILISTGSESDSLLNIQEADSIITLLKAGDDFNKLAEDNSDDPSSAMRGGQLSSFYSRSSGFDDSGAPVVTEFEEAMFAMKDGEISGKVFTDYGIHIIRRDSTRAFDPEAEREEMRKVYKRLYLKKAKEKLLDSLAKSYGFKLYDNTLTALTSAIDTTKTNLDSAWTSKIDNNLASQQLYMIFNKSYTVQDFVKKSINDNGLRGQSLNEKGIRATIDKIIKPMVFDEATRNLENENEDFASLMNEFHDGILLFRVEALEVWDKLGFDSTLAREYWEQRKENYVIDDRYSVIEIYVLTDSMANAIYDRAMKGEEFSKLAAESTMRDGYREKQGNWGIVHAGNNALAQNAKAADATAGAILKPFKNGKGWSIIKVVSKEPNIVKTFEQAIPDFAAEFQDMMQKKLTKQWLDRVKNDFPVEIYKEKLLDMIDNSN